MDVVHNTQQVYLYKASLIITAVACLDGRENLRSATCITRQPLPFQLSLKYR